MPSHHSQLRPKSIAILLYTGIHWNTLEYTGIHNSWCPNHTNTALQGTSDRPTLTCVVQILGSRFMVWGGEGATLGYTFSNSGRTGQTRIGRGVIPGVLGRWLVWYLHLTCKRLYSVYTNPRNVLPRGGFLAPVVLKTPRIQQLKTSSSDAVLLHGYRFMALGGGNTNWGATLRPNLLVLRDLGEGTVRPCLLR
jgi:hypothetical protein